MELSQLLGTRFRCGCGRTHRLPVQRLVYDPAGLERLPEIVREWIGSDSSQPAMLVADERTWEVAGRRASAALESAAGPVEHVIVPDGEQGGPVCDDRTYESLLARLKRSSPDLLVAVGSGVINDLCKWTSYEMGIPYVVVATAASMNGYAAANVAATVAGVKILIVARPPVAVVAEPDVIGGAPPEMIAAGFGDTIAKHQSNADWRMNHLLFGEYYCEFCAGIVAELEPFYLERPEDVKEGKASAVEGLFAALFWSGVAMTLVGTSAPASGGEHLLSHTLDMVAQLRGRPHDLHGRQVGIGTILSAALYERILRIDAPKLHALPDQIDRGVWKGGALGEAVARQYADKRASLEGAARTLADRQTWDRLRSHLASLSRPAQTVADCLARAGAATTAADIRCSKEQLREAALHMHEIRSRFTVVDLAWMLGVLPDGIDDIMDQWLLP